MTGSRKQKLASAIQCALFMGVASMLSGNALAQDQNEAAGDKKAEAKTLDAVTVTGSRIKRAEIEGALPVTVISRQELEVSGKVMVSDFLRETSFNSFGSYQTTSGSSGLGASTINLRGLGSSRTLVLIDGRRATTTAILGSGQNLNSIPMAAVERIEMLSDGASSIYGSDAIGGVVNIITRKDYEGAEFTIGKGFPRHDGGDTEEMSMLLGASSDRARVLAGASYSNRDVLFDRDRPYLMVPRGSSVYSNNFALRPSTAAGNRLNHPTFGTTVPGDCIAGTNNFYTTVASGRLLCQFEHTQTSADLSSTTVNSVFFRSDVQINDDWTMYFNADSNRVRAFGRYAPVPSSPWPGGAIRLLPGTPNHPGTIGGNNPHASDAYYQGLAGQTLYLFHRFAALGTRDSTTTETTNNYLMGFQGRVADKVDLDFGMRYSEASGMVIGKNYVVAGLAQAAIDSGAYNIYNPFAGNPNGLGITATISRDLKSTMKEVYANASFDLFEMSGGAASAAIGAERREEFYQDNYDPLSEAGQVVGSAGNSASGGRTVSAAYFEVLFPITKTFEVDVAGRYDRYSDYGSDFSPKVSMRWHPIESLTLRGAYGNGFRAPSLDILTQKTTFSATSTTDPQTCMLLVGRPDCSTQVSTYSIANPNLTSESSKQWSLGVVWDATDWLSMTLDHWDTHIDDQITSTSLATVVRCLRGLPGLCPAGLAQFPDGTILPNESLGVGASFDPTTGGITGAQLGYVNLGTVDINGYDFSARTNFDLGWGRLQNQLTWSMYSHYSSNGGANIVGTMGAPKHRAGLSNALSVGDWSFNWNMNYIHSTENNAGDGRLPSWLIHNVQVGYTTPWKGTISVGVNNVADKDPVFDPVLGGPSYDSTLYNPWGRVLYVRYTQRF